MTRFTSSTAVGRAVVATANARGTPVPAELGGANTALVPPGKGTAAMRFFTAERTLTMPGGTHK
ncbi:hypothetical protein [Kitasatospora aureofaciens]|uniref:hypothetical protein n=1 Tax=Kitasatospora aureofaciens TaxID=1894 RepID=UPI0036F4731A